MDCRRIEQLISPYIDGEITAAESAWVSNHLSHCASCQQEYESLICLTSYMKKLSSYTVSAPSGFKDLVMQQINNETEVVARVKKSHWFSQSKWRNIAVSAAAAVMLFWGAISLNAGPIAQLANNDNPPAGSEIVTPEVNNSEYYTNPTSLTNPIPVTGQGNNTSPNLASTDKPVGVQSMPVFLNKERFIITTFLQLKVNDQSMAVENVQTIAAKYQAETQNLGQQLNETGSYTVIKILAAKTYSSDLINEIKSLGTVSNQEFDKSDITSRYAETLSQYQILVSQRATSTDDNLKLQLDQQIQSLAAELRDWEQKAEEETIVIWLEK